MPRAFVRYIAALLVLCLAADPTLAFSLCSPRVFSQFPASSIVFRLQAIPAMRGFYTRPDFKKTASRAFRSLRQKLDTGVLGTASSFAALPALSEGPNSTSFQIVRHELELFAIIVGFTLGGLFLIYFIRMLRATHTRSHRLDRKPPVFALAVAEHTPHKAGSKGFETTLPKRLTTHLRRGLTAASLPPVVLEAGAAEGHVAQYLQDQGFHVLALEKNRPMMATAREAFPQILPEQSSAAEALSLLRNSEKAAIAIQQMDLVRGIDLPDNSVDAIVLHRTLSMIVDPQARKQLMGEMYRVLRPGGWISFLDYRPLQETDPVSVEKKPVFKLHRRVFQRLRDAGLLPVELQNVADDPAKRVLLITIHPDGTPVRDFAMSEDDLFNALVSGTVNLISAAIHEDMSSLQQQFAVAGFSNFEFQQAEVDRFGQPGTVPLSGFVARKMPPMFPLLDSGLNPAEIYGEKAYESLKKDWETLREYLAIRDQLPAHLDALFVFGSDLVQVPLGAAELAKTVSVDHIVVSGGKGRLTPSAWTEGEAVEYAKILKHLGIKALVEPRSTTTWQNATYSKALLEQTGTRARHIGVLQSPLLQRRAMGDVKAAYGADSEVEFFAWAPYIPDFDQGPAPWPLAEWRRRQLFDVFGEIVRLLDYQRQGFIPKDPVPQALIEKAQRIGETLHSDVSIPESDRVLIGKNLEILVNFQRSPLREVWTVSRSILLGLLFLHVLPWTSVDALTSVLLGAAFFTRATNSSLRRSPMPRRELCQAA